MSVLEPRIVVRFNNDVPVPSDPTQLLEESDAELWGDLIREGGQISLEPVFSALEPEDLLQLQEQAVERDPDYQPERLDFFFYVDVSAEENLSAVARVLRKWAIVRSAEIEVIGPDPYTPGSDAFSAQQGHLDPAPVGIDARYAWSITGGTGAGQRFVDMEAGWTLEHQDLAARAVRLIHGSNWDARREHGTSVLGVIAAKNSTGTGIAFDVAEMLTSSYANSSVANAISVAASNLRPGDVLLIEAQAQVKTYRGAPQYGPVETLDALYEAIRLATANGIIVVEAAGNGTGNGFEPATDLDAWPNQAGLHVLRRDADRQKPYPDKQKRDPDEQISNFRDSGAIMVTAATSCWPHRRLGYASYGSRIDCFGWGENVYTASSNRIGATDLHTRYFGGTSSASAIVAGAALVLQGVCEANGKPRLSPHEMRARLNDPTKNTPPDRSEETAIGVMPDLRALIEAELGLPSDAQTDSADTPSSLDYLCGGTSDRSAQDFFCLPGSRDPNWRPPVSELFEWYEKLCKRLSDPRLPWAADTDPSVEHDVTKVRHIPPESLPSIELIRELYKRCCRPDAYHEEPSVPVAEREIGVPPHTAGTSTFHQWLHRMGFI
jgi:serine protease